LRKRKKFRVGVNGLAQNLAAPTRARYGAPEVKADAASRSKRPLVDPNADSLAIGATCASAATFRLVEQLEKKSTEKSSREGRKILFDHYELAPILANQHGRDHHQPFDDHLRVLIDAKEIQSVVQDGYDQYTQ